VTLPYEMVLEPAAASGALYLYQFRGNSAFDPDYTSTGAQPTGFDQWAAFFNEYVVLSSSIELELMGGTSGSVEYVIYPSYNTTSPASSLDASARPYAKRVVISSNGNSVHARLHQSMSTAQMLGVKPEAIIDDDAYGATISANPGSAAVWYWSVVAQNINNTNTLADVIRVRLLFDVLFHDRVQLSLSLSTRGNTATPVHDPSHDGVPASSGAAAAAPQVTARDLDALRLCCDFMARCSPR